MKPIEIKKMKNKMKTPLIAMGLCTVIGAGCEKQESPPNVVFILADDLGWTQTSAYGSQYYKTPNIDRLAAEGIRFTNAYSSAAICSPTRAAIMTGKYPAKLHLTDFIKGGNIPNTLLQEPNWQKFLPLGETTIAEIFKEKGFRTAFFGKWHLSKEKFGAEALPNYPDKQGFDDSFVIDKPSPKDNPENDPHKSDSIGNVSVKFLRQNKNNPFFLFASFSAIHNPLMDSADSIAIWKKKEGSEKPENNPVVAAMLSRMDRNIGKILDALVEFGLYDNTIVIFTSDNGGLQEDALQTPLRMGKGWLYEGGIRIPLVIRWPGTVHKSTLSEQPITSIDFLPTFCDLLNSEKPNDIDGISLFPLLKENKAINLRDIFWHYPHYHSVGSTPCGAIRSGRWKLIENFEKSLTGQTVSAFELYDLDTDPEEKVNLAASKEEIVMELAEKLIDWREKMNAQMPQIRQ